MVRLKKYKVSRRTGIDLFNKNISIFKLRSKPGEIGKRRSMPTPYGILLRHKQALKYYYGNIRERQLKNMFSEARKAQTQTLAAFIQNIERRMDVFLWRAGIGKTIFHTQQIISHGFVCLNNRKHNIRSYIIRDQDIISLSPRFFQRGDSADILSVTDWPYLSRGENSFRWNSQQPFDVTKLKLPAQLNLRSVLLYYS